MNWITVICGFAMMAFGISTGLLQLVRPQVFGKLDAMKQFWGPRTGVLIHVMGYSIIPLIGGAFVLFNGLRGASLFN